MSATLLKYYLDKTPHKKIETYSSCLLSTAVVEALPSFIVKNDDTGNFMRFCTILGHQ